MHARYPKRWIAALLALTVLLGIAVAEVCGWPFLAAPLEQALSKRIGQQVSFAADPATHVSQQKPFQLRLLWGVRLAVEQSEISAPVWSRAPQLLLATNFAVNLSLADAWRAYHGRDFSIRRVTVKKLDVALERMADGRISTPLLQNAIAPSVERWGIDAGTVRYRDEHTMINVVRICTAQRNPRLPPRAAICHRNERAFLMNVDRRKQGRRRSMEHFADNL